MGKKVGEKVVEKTGEKVGESLGEIDKLNRNFGMREKLKSHMKNHCLRQINQTIQRIIKSPMG